MSFAPKPRLVPDPVLVRQEGYILGEGEEPLNEIEAEPDLWGKEDTGCGPSCQCRIEESESEEENSSSEESSEAEAT